MTGTRFGFQRLVLPTLAFFLALGWLLSCAPASAAAEDSAVVANSGPDAVEIGRRIYQEGVLPSGKPLEAVRAGGVILRGESGACMQCHRRSGYGVAEGKSVVPPVVGDVLFAPGRYLGTLPPQTRLAPGFKLLPMRADSRPAYDEASLAHALSTGKDPLDRPFDALMPRYMLEKPAVAALSAYLRSLSAEPAPGITSAEMHVATVIAPDVSPQARKAVLSVLQAWFDQLRTGRRWILHVWELTGPAEQWDAQLEQHYSGQPVYAMLSGLGGADWQPVQRFCERRRVPCLFPNVEVAPALDQDFYSMYFSSGVDLEARVLARHLLDHRQQDAVGRVVQIQSDAAGAHAAAVLKDVLERQGVPTFTRQFDADSPVEAARGLGAADALVLWLRAPQVTQVGELADSVVPGQVFVSAMMAPPGRVTLPAAWKQVLQFVTVFDEPARQYGQAVLSVLPWLERNGVPLTDLRLQADTYSACYLFSEVLGRMRGRFNREYLLESLEVTVEARITTPTYPTLSLGPGQRVAAKGGGLLRYLSADADRLVRAGPRIVP